MALTPQEMLRRMVAKLPEKTGKDYAAWVELARASGIDTHRELTAWLKENHGELNHNDAQWIAWGVTDPGRLESYDRPADLVAELYAGKKAHLRPIHDQLLDTVLGLGDDTRPSVCKTYTSVGRKTQFAIIAARTNQLVDLELALPPDGQRLEALKNTNPRFQSRIRIGSVDEIDDQVIAALRQAYESVG